MMAEADHRLLATLGAGGFVRPRYAPTRRERLDIRARLSIITGRSGSSRSKVRGARPGSGLSQPQITRPRCHRVEMRNDSDIDPSRVEKSSRGRCARVIRAWGRGGGDERIGDGARPAGITSRRL